MLTWLKKRLRSWLLDGEDAWPTLSRVLECLVPGEKGGPPQFQTYRVVGALGLKLLAIPTSQPAEATRLIGPEQVLPVDRERWWRLWREYSPMARAGELRWEGGELVKLKSLGAPRDLFSGEDPPR